MARRLTFASLSLLLVVSCRQLEEQKYDAVYGSGARRLVVATASPGETGLLKVIAETFTEQEGVVLCWKKAGSGKSLQLLREKRADAVMVHAPEAERRAVRDGWATGRTLIGSNEFFIVGPAHDPAGIGTAKTVAEAYGKIAASRAKFFSRADNSGTHKKEMAIWKKAAIAPQGDWYVGTGDFMMATLKRAHAETGYFMTDSSTWLVARKHMPNLKLLFRGDPFMVNVYHALCQPAGATPGACMAERFAAFLASEKAQQLIRDFGKDAYGEALYSDANYAKQHE